MGFGGKKKGGTAKKVPIGETVFNPDLALAGPPMPQPTGEDDYERMLAADRAQREGGAPVQNQPDPMDIMFDSPGMMTPAAPVGKPKLKYRPKYDPAGDGPKHAMQEIFCARCQTPIAIPQQRPVEITCSVCGDVRVYT